MNMLTFYFFGSALEYNFGSETLANTYLFGALSAGLSGYYVNIFKQGSTYLLGASGSVYAIMGYYILSFPYTSVYLYGLIKCPAWVIGALLFA